MSGSTGTGPLGPTPGATGCPEDGTPPGVWMGLENPVFPVCNGTVPGGLTTGDKLPRWTGLVGMTGATSFDAGDETGGTDGCVGAAAPIGVVGRLGAGFAAGADFARGAGFADAVP